MTKWNSFLRKNRKMILTLVILFVFTYNSPQIANATSQVEEGDVIEASLTILSGSGDLEGIKRIFIGNVIPASVEEQYEAVITVSETLWKGMLGMEEEQTRDIQVSESLFYTVELQKILLKAKKPEGVSDMVIFGIGLVDAIIIFLILGVLGLLIWKGLPYLNDRFTTMRIGACEECGNSGDGKCNKCHKTYCRSCFYKKKSCPNCGSTRFRPISI